MLNGADQISCMFAHMSWTFWASTDIRFTICPTVEPVLAEFDNLRAWNEYYDFKWNEKENKDDNGDF